MLGPLVAMGKVWAGDEDSSALPRLVLDERRGLGDGSPLETREKMSDRELGVILRVDFSKMFWLPEREDWEIGEMEFCVEEGRF